MEYRIQSQQPENQRDACLVLGVFEDAETWHGTAQRVNAATDGLLDRLRQRGDIEGKAKQSLLVPVLPDQAPYARLLLVGCGKSDDFNAAAFRKAAATAAGALAPLRTDTAVIALTELPVTDRDAAWKVRQTVLALENRLYRYDRTKSDKADPSPLQTAVLAVTEGEEAGAERAAREAAATAAGVAFARTLGNLPGNVCTPTYIAEQAEALAAEHDKASIEVLEEADMEALGMGALLSVSRGSRQPAKLIVLEYRGGNDGDPPQVLVGKGLTFDAGGISLKPAAAMDEMKFDMCGGASVLGAFKACLELDLPINLVVVVPSSENLPDGAANKPGDVVTSLSGQTIEILNTDAEGRLILCDALTYSERFHPDTVIDVATLTGACVVALGKHASALYTEDEDLAATLTRCGEDSGDRVWRMPLWDDYQEQLDSNFADMANVGGPEAGSVTAACFLARYAKAFRWAHLDIAGTAWLKGQQKGSTGRVVPLLTQYLIDRAGQA